jgi:hypothetical protein
MLMSTPKTKRSVHESTSARRIGDPISEKNESIKNSVAIAMDIASIISLFLSLPYFALMSYFLFIFIFFIRLHPFLISS